MRIQSEELSDAIENANDLRKHLYEVEQALDGKGSYVEQITALQAENAELKGRDEERVRKWAGTVAQKDEQITALQARVAELEVQLDDKADHFDAR